MRIDLNADLGEGYGPWRMGDDEGLLDVLSSANIACGFHAGDPLIMERTVRLATARGVDIGAHVGFPDRQGFGRRVMQVERDELCAMVVYQLGALAGIARAQGASMTHMSFHGALGNMAAADPDLAAPLVAAVARFDPGLTVLTSPSRAIEDAAAAHGLRVAKTFLADRACDRDGLLVPRRLPGAVIHDEAQVLERVRRLLADGVVVTHEGERLSLSPDTILVHGDTPGALALARAVRQAVSEAGGEIVPLSRQGAAPA
ncbi:LamB/YcsF family protein [Methylobacterium nonmethylotrophicum]|uniref:5-oxoprolinase subunit A n=1 Tax=Methylobacterium nonmethylotrophicum TaxID=1141884 RepID=A0A4Z0NRZ7_9HYPH|nr:5-oxoprolinase subunit PxpA [Methylobacterium nonmethylotrophicum]TGD99680.1 5-oxoprolinase subunit PxpA [Methylobacterium nonmethylotrophicum]